MNPAIAAANGKALNCLDLSMLFNRAEQFAESDLPLTAYKVVDFLWFVGIRGKAWIVPANDNFHFRFQGANQFDDPSGSPPLKSHDGQADDLRLQLLHESCHGFADASLNQDEIRNRDLVVRIEVPSKGS